MDLMGGKHSGGPMETMEFDGQRTHEGYPKEVIEAMTSAKGQQVGDDTTAYRIRNARRKLGTGESYEIVGGCKTHTGKKADDGLTSQFAWPQSFELDTNPRCGYSTVQGGLTALTKSTIERECVFCVQEGVDRPPKCQVALDWNSGKREMFFVYVPHGLDDDDFSVEVVGVEHSPVVFLFGDQYILSGVIYRTKTGGGHHFVTQTYIDGCWWMYNDCTPDGALQHFHTFETEYLRGRENTLMYVRVDMVEKSLAMQVVERPASYGVNDESGEVCLDPDQVALSNSERNMDTASFTIKSLNTNLDCAFTNWMYSPLPRAGSVRFLNVVYRLFCISVHR